MELSTYFRINSANTGQFERTLIVAEEGSYVSYLEGCTAPMRDEHQLHAAVAAPTRKIDSLQMRFSRRMCPPQELMRPTFKSLASEATTTALKRAALLCAAGFREQPFLWRVVHARPAGRRVAA